MLCGWKDLVGGWFLLVSLLARGSLPGTLVPCVSTSPGALLMSSPSVLSSRRQEQRGQRGQHRQHPQRRQRTEHRGHQRAEHQHPHRECQGRCQPLLPPHCSPSSTRCGGNGAQNDPVTPCTSWQGGGRRSRAPPTKHTFAAGTQGGNVPGAGVSWLLQQHSSAPWEWLVPCHIFTSSCVT